MNPEQREWRILSQVYRNMKLVDPKLFTLFRSLVRGSARWPLYLHGAAGRGKTLAALSLCDWIPRAGYYVPNDLCEAIVNPSRFNFWESVREKPVVVLDELGAREHVGDLPYEAVKRFADCRELHAGRVAVYISNLTPKQIADVYDDRIASRILCGSWFELTGPDRRMTT